MLDARLVMINPGDGKGTGRMIVDGYERGVTMNMAEELGKKLSERYGVRCVVTRKPGEELKDLQGASFANRMNADFFISLHAYHQEQLKPHLYLYHLVYNPLVDCTPHQFVPLTFIPLHQAHFFRCLQTRQLGEAIKDILGQSHHKKILDVDGIFGIPFRPLCGIVAPALALEVGLSHEGHWKTIISSLVESMSFLGHY